MNPLKSLSDTQLLLETKRLALEERRIGIEVIRHLAEVYARRLYSARGYSNLYEYAIRELGYAGGSAHRRIAAMHLLNQVPEYEAKLKEGSVTVSTLSQVGSFIYQEGRQRNEMYSKNEKLELLSQVEGKSSRETAQILSGISPESARPERTRVLSPEATEIRFTADQDLMKKLDRLKEVFSHRPQIRSGIAGLIDQMADVLLKEYDPLEKEKATRARASRVKSQAEKVKQATPPRPALAANSEAKPTRFISAAVRRAIWLRDQGRCQYRDSKTGRQCLSRHRIQIEHRIPFAKGDASDVGNSRLMCASHNAFLAIREYGPRKMHFYRLSLEC